MKQKVSAKEKSQTKNRLWKLQLKKNILLVMRFLQYGIIVFLFVYFELQFRAVFLLLITSLILALYLNNLINKVNSQIKTLDLTLFLIAIIETEISPVKAREDIRFDEVYRLIFDEK